MKIAIPYENGMVFQHFGHTAEFKFYEVENGQVTASEVVSTNGQGHGALVGFLAQHNAKDVYKRQPLNSSRVSSSRVLSFAMQSETMQPVSL